MSTKVCPEGHEFGPNNNNEWLCDRCNKGPVEEIATQAVQSDATLSEPAQEDAPEATVNAPAEGEAVAENQSTDTAGEHTEPAQEAPAEVAAPEAPIEAPKADDTNANQAQ